MIKNSFLGWCCWGLSWSCWGFSWSCRSLGFGNKGFFCHDHSLNTVVHVLDQIDLASSKSSSVGDIENSIISLRVLSVDTSDLDVELVRNLLKFSFVGFRSKVRKFDMHRSSHGSTKVGWTRSNVTKMLVISKFSHLFDLSSTDGKSSEDFSNVGSFFHGNDSKLILLVDPDEECLVFVMVDTSSGWPVSIETTSVKESVSLLEEEVISNQLFLIFL